ncbi:MAG: hypothetical protein M0026_06850 [Nocardiopsaceae bacterium]|nr:hypothetical protein [Nocardiopsaceae bacterium]
MPGKPRKVSAFFKILLALTLACGVLVAGGFYVMRKIQPIEVEPPKPKNVCTITAQGDTDQLEPEQAANAATISGVAFSKDLPEEAVVIAYATVWQESKFFNIDYGDRDSVGLFQQRPSQKWGTPEQLLDPVYSAGAFYDKLTDISGYTDIPVYEAAQAVQRSADGFAYDQHEHLSRMMASAFTGSAGSPVVCMLDPEKAEETDVAAAEEEMTRVFGVEPTAVAAAGQRSTGDLGWAMAQWAVANAQAYGLTSVTYQDQRWTLNHEGQDGQKGSSWSTVPDAAPAGEIVLK